jgi:hypothetical protein
MKIGNLVSVYGITTFTQTSLSTPTNFYISLPIPTKVYQFSDVIGIGAMTGDSTSIRITGLTTNSTIANCFTYCKTTGAVASTNHFNYILQG